MSQHRQKPTPEETDDRSKPQTGEMKSLQIYISTTNHTDISTETLSNYCNMDKV